jgi:hypothetical protein
MEGDHLAMQEHFSLIFMHGAFRCISLRVQVFLQKKEAEPVIALPL